MGAIGAHVVRVAAYLAPLRRINWYVYSKPPFGGPKAVLAYLSRYTHRVAISNRPLAATSSAMPTAKRPRTSTPGTTNPKRGRPRCLPKTKRAGSPSTWRGCQSCWGSGTATADPGQWPNSRRICLSETSGAAG